MTKDRIKNGEVTLFSGNAAWHQLCWLVLPLLLAFYFCIVVATTRASTRPTSTIAAYFSQATSSGELQQRHGVVLRVLNTLIRPACGLGVLGTLMVILNLLSPAGCGHSGDSGGCLSDPFISTTSASIRQQPSVAYQYCWVILSCTVTAVLIYIQELCRRNHVRQAELLVETLTFVVETNSLQHTAITAWQKKAGIKPDHHRVELPRRAIVIVLTLPLVMLSSFPAFAFVMSEK